MRCSLRHTKKNESEHLDGQSHGLLLTVVVVAVVVAVAVVVVAIVVVVFTLNRFSTQHRQHT